MTGVITNDPRLFGAPQPAASALAPRAARQLRPIARRRCRGGARARRSACLGAREQVPRSRSVGLRARPIPTATCSRISSSASSSARASVSTEPAVASGQITANRDGPGEPRPCRLRGRRSRIAAVTSRSVWSRSRAGRLVPHRSRRAAAARAGACSASRARAPASSSPSNAATFAIPVSGSTKAFRSSRRRPRTHATHSASAISAERDEPGPHRRRDAVDEVEEGRQTATAPARARRGSRSAHGAVLRRAPCRRAPASRAPRAVARAGCRSRSGPNTASACRPPGRCAERGRPAPVAAACSRARLRLAGDAARELERSARPRAEVHPARAGSDVWSAGVPGADLDRAAAVCGSASTRRRSARREVAGEVAPGTGGRRGQRRTAADGHASAAARRCR